MQHYHLNTISSTNDYAKELLETEPLVAVSADHQSAGRGRKNKIWFGNFGDNLYLSIGIDHSKVKVKSNLVLYQAIGCLAVKKSIEALTKLKSLRIKYPNDLMVRFGENRKKICGVLAEHSFIGQDCQNTVIGIGVNIRQKEFPAEISDTAISLLNLGYDIQLNDMTSVLISDLDFYLKKSSNELMRIWKKELNIENKSAIIVGEEGSYFVKRLMEDGQLKLVNTKTDDIRIINNGDSIRYDLD